MNNRFKKMLDFINTAKSYQINKRYRILKHFIVVNCVLLQKLKFTTTPFFNDQSNGTWFLTENNSMYLSSL